jgi:membrane carboxypeptidase/penicillin-binding protein PbpC
VLATWIGNFSGEGNNAFIGRTAAGPLLFRLFDVIQNQELAEHSGLKIPTLQSSTSDLSDEQAVFLSTKGLSSALEPSSVRETLPAIGPYSSNQMQIIKCKRST